MSSDALDDGVLYEDQVAPEYGVLGMTLREFLIVAFWVVGFAVSFFPLGGHGSPSLWQSGLHWVLPVAVPTVAVFLIVLRRFSPEGIRRVGSLGIDQFASVAFSVSALLWVQLLWDLGSASVSDGAFLVGWSTILETTVALALVVLTVAAPLIPGLREDFHGRLETLAHRNANPVRPVIARPLAEREVPAVGTADARDDDDAAAGELLLAPGLDAAIPAEESSPGDADAEVDSETDTAALMSELLADTATDGDDDEDQPEGSPAWDAAQPFWILAPDAREVFDEHGQELFRIGPEAWALVIEDRGGAYVVRHDDGRIGYLHDITNITKG